MSETKRPPGLSWTMIVVYALALVVCGVGYDFLGCGKAKVRENPERVALMKDIEELGRAYASFQTTEGRPPRSFVELNTKYPLPASCSQVTVYWGAGMRDMCKEEATWDDVVVAHCLTPNGKSVVALMCDGSVKGMAPETLEGAKKAKPLPTAGTY
jgi:hypothetical protein